MCNEYAREIAIAKLIKEFSRTKQLPLVAWHDGRIPNDADEKASIKIRDSAPVMSLDGDKLVGQVRTWAWLAKNKKPVFNFVSENRDFSKSERVLIPATGFYEYTDPEMPKIKFKDRHLFTLRDHEWFWIAGIVQEECFTMLTTEPGPDIEHYHDRQIVVLPPDRGADWLRLSRPQNEILTHLPGGSLDVRTVRKNGQPLVV